MIIDVHGHIGRLNFNPIWTASAAELEPILEWAGVDYCIVSSARALTYDIAEGNQEVLDAVERHPRILGYVVANPVYPAESLEDLARAADHPRLVGCKMHPDYHGYDAAAAFVHRFMDRAVRHVKIFLFHCSVMAGSSFAAAEKILGLAREHPETTFILGHAAGLGLHPLYPYHPDYQSSIDKIAEGDFPNVYIDTANGVLLSFPSVFETVISRLGAGRLLFGTDVPIARATRVKGQIAEIMWTGIPAEQKQAILGLNAQILLESAGVIV